MRPVFLSSLRIALPFVIGIYLSANSRASVVINVAARTLLDSKGDVIAPGTLVQFVNLGPNGVFDQVSLFDSGLTGPSLWVSGDDSLIDVPFNVQGSLPGDFPSAAAFDLTYSGSPESTIGRMARVFDFASLPVGMKVGIRWWPQYQATDYPNITRDTILSRDEPYRYGEFTRQSSPMYNGDLWVVPSDGSVVNFDPLRTTAAGGLDSTALATAKNGPLS